MPIIRRRPSQTLGIPNRQILSPQQNPNDNNGPTAADIAAAQTAQAQAQQVQQTPQAYAQRGMMMQQAQQPSYQPGMNWPQNNSTPGPSWAVLDALKQQPAQAQIAAQASDDAQRATLAQSLGYKTTQTYNNPTLGPSTIASRDAHGNLTYPSHSQLQGQFMQLPQYKQAQIYKAGGAPFFDQDDSGANLLQNQNDAQEGALKDQIGELGKMVANGSMTFDPTDRKFYQVITDPANPEAGLKKKVPISLLQAQIYTEGVKRGMLPDADTLYKQQIQPQGQTTSGQNAGPNAPGSNISPAVLQKVGLTQQTPGVSSQQTQVPGQGVYPAVQSIRNLLPTPNANGSNDTMANIPIAVGNVGTDISNMGTSVDNMKTNLSNAAIQLLTGTNSRILPLAPYENTRPFYGGNNPAPQVDPVVQKQLDDSAALGNPYQ